MTIYCASTVAQGGVKILCTSTVPGSTGQVAFNSAGGTQALSLITNATLTNQDISVTLIGESATQWRVMSAWPAATAHRRSRAFSSARNAFRDGVGQLRSAPSCWGTQ